MDTLNRIKEQKLIAILRGVAPSEILKVANALYDGGIRLLEITMNSEDPLKSIEEVAKHMGERMLIGAGTVLDLEMAANASDAGAKFILSPNTDQATISKTKELGMVSIPGAYTPTEILNAFNMGGDIIKVFPAGAGGAAYIKDVMGPLAHIPMLATGGISLENIANFKSLGLVGYGLGGSLVKAGKQFLQSDLEEIKNNASRFVAAISK